MRFLKIPLDSQWCWDWLLGPVYNRRIWEAESELVTQFVKNTPPPPNAKVLDVGCGPGYATWLYA